MKSFWAKANGKKAELYLYDAIGADYFGDGITAKSVADALKEFTPGADIDIYVNSPGGSVFDGVAIYNQLNRWGGKKHVHIDGIAASIASVIAMVGDTIEIAASGTLMIHSAWGIAVGNAKEMRAYADSLELIDGTILDTYIARTGGKKDEIKAWMDAETWMNADDAVKRGFATSKTSAKTMEASFDLLSKFKNTPANLRKQSMASSVALAKVDARIRARGIARA